MQDIVLKELTKRYGDVVGLPPISARIPAGEVTCLLGPSGSGKTTLLRMLVGLEEPSGGDFSGVPAKVGVVFQEDRLLRSFSAVTNIKAAVGKDIREKEIVETLAQLGLIGWERKPVKELSGGMRRRVAIARALLFSAEAMFMDEPFKGLDSDTKNLVMGVVQEKTRSKTLLLITHDEGEARFFGGNILRLGK